MWAASRHGARCPPFLRLPENMQVFMHSELSGESLRLRYKVNPTKLSDTAFAPRTMKSSRSNGQKP